MRTEMAEDWKEPVFYQAKVRMKTTLCRAITYTVVVCVDAAETSAKIKKKLKTELEARSQDSEFPDVNIEIPEMKKIRSDAFIWL